MCCLFLQERNCVFFLLFLLQHVLNLYVKIIIIKKGGIGRMCLLFIIVRGEREREREIRVINFVVFLNFEQQKNE